MKGVEQEAKKSLLTGRVTLLIIILVIFGVGGFYLYPYFSKMVSKEPITTEKPIIESLKLDPNKEQSHLSRVGPTKNAYWLRACDLTWNNIEPSKGEYDWKMMDARIKELTGEGIYPLVTIRPFANWDQQVCHSDSLYDAEMDPMKGGKLKVGKPCDMVAYQEFLKKAIERYDGDGIDDMPGLTIPIKYWEILNEPVMQGNSTGGMGEELKFFVGTSDEYLDILKASYQTIKEADPEAQVVQGGMAGMQKEVREFWAPILDQGGGDYFDIVNNHTISTDERREDLYMIKLKKFLKKHDIVNKPIWITEVQYGSLTEKPDDLKEMEVLMAKSTIFSLALGADKLFYIENWLRWDKEEFSQEELNSSTHKVYLNLIDKVNNFDKVETIKQEYKNDPEGYEGAVSSVGQYKFVNGKDELYVLWGKAQLPKAITGRIKVIDIYGEEQEIQASKLKLTDEPIFVKME